MPMLDYLDSLDFDCLLHIDVAFRDVDLYAIKDKLARRKSFWIGPSSVYHMGGEGPGAVRSAVRQVMEVFGKTGVLITPCPSAHSIMPWPNTQAMIDEWIIVRTGSSAPKLDS
jgi:hypothetical protein